MSEPAGPPRSEPRRTPRTAAAVIAGLAVLAALIVVGLLGSAIGAPAWLTFGVVGGLCALVVLAYVLN